MGGGKQTLTVGTLDQGDHIPAGALLLSGNGSGDEVIQLGVVIGHSDALLVFGQVLDVANLAGLDFQISGEVQSFETLECSEHIHSADADTVIFQNGDIAAAGKDLTDLVAQIITAGDTINGDLCISADTADGGDQIQIGNTAGDGESNQCRGMGMQNCLQVRTHLVDGCVEGQLGGGTMRTFGSAVGMDTDDILTGQSTLVHAGRGDPDVAVAVHDGEVAAGGGGQTLVINTLHEHDQLVCGVHVLNIHKFPSFLEQGKR